MKVLIINACDIRGGAARAAYRLHQGLCNIAIDSKMLVQEKLSNDKTVILPNTILKKINPWLRPALDKIPSLKYFKKSLISPAWVPFSPIPKMIEQLDPDIVHLHWICRGMISIKDLEKIRKPIVWTFHDMWPFTGGEHYIENPLDTYQKKILDLKKRTWSKVNLTIVSPSKWLAEEAKKSDLFKEKKIKVIPNGIDTKIFRPFSKDNARRELNLPLDKKLILFGAAGSLEDLRKGFFQIKEVFGSLDKDIELVVFGNSKKINLNIKTHFLGKLKNDDLLANLYSGVDLTMVPSLQENLSNVILESLSCGTPVVCFDIGGNPDMIDHKKNGYIVNKNKPEDFLVGINWILANLQSLEIRCKVIEKFSINQIANRYKDLYREIMV